MANKKLFDGKPSFRYYSKNIPFFKYTSSKKFLKIGRLLWDRREWSLFFKGFEGIYIYIFSIFVFDFLRTLWQKNEIIQLTTGTISTVQRLLSPETVSAGRPDRRSNKSPLLLLLSSLFFTTKQTHTLTLLLVLQHSQPAGQWVSQCI